MVPPFSPIWFYTIPFLLLYFSHTGFLEHTQFQGHRIRCFVYFYFFVGGGEPGILLLMSSHEWLLVTSWLKCYVFERRYSNIATWSFRHTYILNYCIVFMTFGYISCLLTFPYIYYSENFNYKTFWKKFTLCTCIPNTKIPLFIFC